MTLATRARLAWIPLLLWLSLCAYLATDKLLNNPPTTPLDWIATTLIYGWLGIVTTIGWVRYAQAWGRRAMTEGPDVVIPMTWYKRSGSWLVIGMVTVMVLMFGSLALIAART